MSGPLVYCWRLGAPVAMEDGRCPECGAPSHDLAVPQGACGKWTPCSTLTSEKEHGHLCRLAEGHDGDHWATHEVLP